MNQANIAVTICVAGYTTTVRPPATYTNALKIDQMKAYGLTDLTPADVEEDHLIALEIGGDPRDARNLWPEPRAGSANAANKDALENQLHAEVCAGTRTLIEAQHCIAIDWIACAAFDLSGTVAPTPAATAPATVAPTVAPTSPSATIPPATAPPPPVTFALTITASRYGLISANAGVPGASCTARAKLPSGNFSTAQGLAPTKTTDASGAVSWTYTTVSSTKPGTGTDTVTCLWSGTTLFASAPFTVP